MGFPFLERQMSTRSKDSTSGNNRRADVLSLPTIQGSATRRKSSSVRVYQSECRERSLGIQVALPPFSSLPSLLASTCIFLLFAKWWNDSLSGEKELLASSGRKGLEDTLI
jgi:hypothetical protein